MALDIKKIAIAVVAGIALYFVGIFLLAIIIPDLTNPYQFGCFLGFGLGFPVSYIGFMIKKFTNGEKTLGNVLLAAGVVIGIFAIFYNAYEDKKYSSSSNKSYEFSDSEKRTIKYNEEQAAKFTEENQKYMKYKGTTFDINHSYNMAIHYKYENCKIYAKDKSIYDSKSCSQVEKDYFTRHK